MWINSTHTLWSERNQDTWQLPLLSSDGLYCGSVVGQIIDPREYLVRYFLIFSHLQGRQYMLPSECIDNIDQVLRCRQPAVLLSQLPTFKQNVSREDEMTIHSLLEQVPYWF